MKTIRRVDELGRIVIPKTMRSALNMQTGTHVEVTCDDNGVVKVRAAGERCAVCGGEIGGDERVVFAPGKEDMRTICMHCAMDIAQKVCAMKANTEA